VREIRVGAGTAADVMAGGARRTSLLGFPSQKLGYPKLSQKNQGYPNLSQKNSRISQVIPQKNLRKKDILFLEKKKGYPFFV